MVVPKNDDAIVEWAIEVFKSKRMIRQDDLPLIRMAALAINKNGRPFGPWMQKVLDFANTKGWLKPPTPPPPPTRHDSVVEERRAEREEIMAAHAGADREMWHHLRDYAALQGVGEVSVGPLTAFGLGPNDPLRFPNPVEHPKEYEAWEAERQRKLDAARRQCEEALRKREELRRQLERANVRLTVALAAQSRARAEAAD